MPTDADITVFETMKKVLGPIRDFTDALGRENQVTASCIMPVLSQW